MLDLKDFVHLPLLDAILEKLVADGPGLIVVAGLDPRSQNSAASDVGFLPSGRSTLFRILMRQILSAESTVQAIVVARDKKAMRVSRQLRRQVNFSQVRAHDSYAAHIDRAIARRPDLLVIDHFGPASAGAALAAAQAGLRVLVQMDTVFRGAEVARSILDLGVPSQHLDALRWVVAVQRIPALCPHCKAPLPAESLQASQLKRLYPDFFAETIDPLYQAVGCAHCRHCGRLGNLAAFDVFQADGLSQDLFQKPSVLPLQTYMLHLVAAGLLPPEDVLRIEPDQLRRTYHMLTASEQALNETNRTLQRKLTELESANRVLQQRTEALVSLQEVGQALISSTDLDDLASKVCQRACDICCADRAVLYYYRSADRAEVLAVNGWDKNLVGQPFDARPLLTLGQEAKTRSFSEPPPGLQLDSAQRNSLQAGLFLPLVAQGEPVGSMIVHTIQSARFGPGEISLLQTFAQQAALAIQRAGLHEQLRHKVEELQAAQLELAQKERLERELELAHEVQQSVLPHTFPQVAGYRFAAQNEPARQVGGDFYDVILFDHDRFGIVIGDVSDKGMPSALYMALTRSLLLAESRRERSPAAVLANVNRLLLQLGNPNMFVTVFYGVVEIASGRLTYARAGHDYPLLLRAGSISELTGRGTVLGLFEPEELHLSEEQRQLAPPDRLILYTDGLTDIVTDNGQLFDRSQLKRLLRSYGELSPDELCSAAFADLRAIQGGAEQFDDMTMLVVAVA